ncbi:phosphoribosylglycinamide formyltransferase [Vibrio spartinae]|uniref:Phosphoribosylglycinamide formyltransferase n=1 Tax=Vibrio spartinae TaxID=1918945 RepID=A0A1N6M204_9VIBR|nr:phosphoribosylglycinamide formyltransferase [Vibrio spartinae]SIO93474.1 Phosphoribosylglycinamide formyltransferase [Vibrio spartinae]
MNNIAFLFSGSGSLLESVSELCSDLINNCHLKLVISNNRDVDLDKLHIPKGTEFHIIDHANYQNRLEHESAIEELLMDNDIHLIVLGGYRRIFSQNFVKKFGCITINTHPSILPSFPGDKAQQSAIDYGVRCSGATVHFINNEVDQGPIIAQSIIEVKMGTQESELRKKITNTEKYLIPQAIRLITSGKISFDGTNIVYHSEINESLLYIGK